MTETSASFSRRFLKFLKKPADQKLESVTFRLRRFFPWKSTEIMLPFGSKWVAESSALGNRLRSGIFETAETDFVQKFIRPGMTVLDIGAHHGFYTLLASARVGKHGRVIAFEPSPRERIRLERHVDLNKCSNVQIESYALGNGDRSADLFLVEGEEDYCNSLRPPAVEAETRTVRVEVTSLDQFLSSNQIKHVDFI